MNVQAEILTIGDELLIGQTVDTNTAWMGKNLNAFGVDVDRVISIRDTREAILEGLNMIKPNTQLVLITGGLGPTKDDVTKHVLLEYFGGELELNQSALKNVEELFGSLGLTVSQVNRDQALLPSSCQPLINKVGTASGMLFKKDNTYFVSMPGVPFEMKFLMNEYVFPLIDKEMITGHIVHKTILTFGIGESMLAEKIEDWENSLSQPLKLAYLPGAGMVKLRLTAKGQNIDQLTQLVESAVEALMPIIADYVYGFNDETIEQLVGTLLKLKKATLATAESCTGGQIASAITSVPGSSAYFIGSVVAYHNRIKENILGVEPALLKEYGAVSKEVVEQMAIGVKTKFGTDFSIATSGVAGPDGGSKDKPVGTVWIAISGPEKTIAKKFTFGNNRGRNIRKSTFMALNILRVMLTKNESF